MSTKLTELFRRYYCDEVGCVGHYVELLPSELVAALIAEGGETLETDPLGVMGRFFKPGRYLVYGPIPAEEETTT